MKRDDFTLRLHAYADGELDAAGTRAVEAHLEGCADCRAELAGIRDLKAALRALDFSETAPEGLAAGIRSRVAQVRARTHMAWAAGSGLLAACLAGALLMVQPSPVNDAVASHHRALDGHNPIVLASTDRTRIKPWLVRQLAFSPPVLEKPAGCAIVGARTDRLAHKAASALTYDCDGHKVDFYAVAERPANSPLTLPYVVKARDYQVVKWQRGRLTCYAVSDAPAPRLLELARYIQSHAAEG